MATDNISNKSIDEIIDAMNELISNIRLRAYEERKMDVYNDALSIMYTNEEVKKAYKSIRDDLNVTDILDKLGKEKEYQKVCKHKIKDAEGNIVSAYKELICLKKGTGIYQCSLCKGYYIDPNSTWHSDVAEFVNKYKELVRNPEETAK